MSKKKRLPKGPPPRSAPYRCGVCGAPIQVTLQGTEAPPTRCDCPSCGTRDSVTPATS